MDASIIDIPPPPTHRPPSPPQRRDSMTPADSRRASIMRELARDQNLQTSTFRSAASIPNPPSAKAPQPPCTSTPIRQSVPPPIPPPPTVQAPTPPRPSPAKSKPLGTPVPPPLPVVGITTPSPSPTLAYSNSSNPTVKPVSTPATALQNNMVAQLAAINLKPHTANSRQETQAPSSSSTMSSDLMQAINRRRCIVDAPAPDEQDIETKMAAARLKANSQTNKTRTSTDG